MSEEPAEDFGPELAVVREALMENELWQRVRTMDHLFELSTGSTEADLRRWQHVAAARGAEPLNVIDMAMSWKPDDVRSLSDSDRLAWLARILSELTETYYGPSWSGPHVAGHDITTPGGLVGALHEMQHPTEETDESP